jgi:vacuolar-type H+-ATPase subunit C/Vma6
MTSIGERAYSYAKACGITGKSFISRRIASLNEVSRFSELDRLVFGLQAKELPERELFSDLERRLSQRSVLAITSVLKGFREPPELFTLLLQVYEYSALKTALSLIAQGETSVKPVFPLLEKFATVNFDAWPNAKAMLAGTDILKCLEDYFKKDGMGGINAEYEGTTLETALDQHYYQKLWACIKKLNKRDCRAAEHIIAEEIALRNCAWALRLRRYYGMNQGEVERHLVKIETAPQLCRDALFSLEFSLDSYEDWTKWKRLRFLNPVPQTGYWRADPRHFQNATSGYLYHLALSHFRRRPCSLDSCFCFIKLKQFEEDLLTSYAEGLGMGMSGKDVLAMLELNND